MFLTPAKSYIKSEHIQFQSAIQPQSELFQRLLSPQKEEHLAKMVQQNAASGNYMRRPIVVQKPKVSAHMSVEFSGTGEK